MTRRAPRRSELPYISKRRPAEPAEARPALDDAAADRARRLESGVLCHECLCHLLERCAAAAAEPRAGRCRLAASGTAWLLCAVRGHRELPSARLGGDMLVGVDMLVGADGGAARRRLVRARIHRRSAAMAEQRVAHEPRPASGAQRRRCNGGARRRRASRSARLRRNLNASRPFMPLPLIAGRMHDGRRRRRVACKWHRRRRHARRPRRPLLHRPRPRFPTL